MVEEPIVYIVDDDASVRDAIRAMLDAEGFPAEAFTSAREFLDAYRENRTGCLLLDVRMPEMDGLQLQRHLNDTGLFLPIIMMSAYGNIPLVVDALREGAVDFIEKPFDEEDLLTRIRRAISSSLRVEVSQAELATIQRRLSLLTAREKEILEKLVAGKWVKLIASELGTSPNTVRNQRTSILEKMEAESVSDLVRMAMLAHFGKSRD